MIARRGVVREATVRIRSTSERVSRRIENATVEPTFRPFIALKTSLGLFTVLPSRVRTEKSGTFSPTVTVPLRFAAPGVLAAAGARARLNAAHNASVPIYRAFIILN